MLKETGFCSGVENYSRHLSLRAEGETPTTLLDFFPEDYLLVVDESHVTLPQVRGMYNGDRARKQTLVNNNYVEQIIRPTGLLDPTIEVKPTEGQIDDIIEQIRIRKEKNERVLITTLTIRMAEELTNYLSSFNIKVAYLHSEIKSLERLKIIQEVRMGKYDVLVGINLLREGIDIPEVSLICIMDADKQGFLRSSRSLIQTIGRCARNASGHVIMYADQISEAMEYSIKETARRREIQDKYNKEHNITPKTIIKEIREVVSNEVDEKKSKQKQKLSKKDKIELMQKIENEMHKAAAELDFERAMELRNVLFEMQSE